MLLPSVLMLILWVARRSAAEASSESREAAACAVPLLQNVTNQQTDAMGSMDNADLDSLMLRINELSKRMKQPVSCRFVDLGCWVVNAWVVGPMQ